MRDTCGNEGAKSLYHTSIYFNDQQTGAFTWNTYAVESSTLTPVTTFELLRDSNNTGFWKVIGVASGTSNILNDPQYGTFQLIANWRVQANGFNCTPTMRYGSGSTQATVVRSKSNITNNRTTFNIGYVGGQVNLYPNPSSGHFTVSGYATIDEINIVDLLGNSVYEARPGKKDIDLVLGTGPGVYFVILRCGNVKTTLKLVLEN